jgi:O-antigen ligase
MAAPQTSPAAPAGTASPRLESILLVGLIAVLMWSPLAFGTTEPWSQFIQRAAVIALLAIWVFWQSQQRGIELSKNPIFLPALTFGLLVVLQFALGATAYRYATLSELLNLCCYAVLILIGGEVLNRRRNLQTLFTALAVFGFALAFFSILQGLSGTSKIYGIRTTTSLSASIFGPYANHNHYAGLMEMLVPLSAAAAILQRGSKRTILLFGTVLMAVSIVFSRSRGGMIALAAGLLFVCMVLFQLQRHRRGLLGILTASAVVGALVLMLGTDKILERLLETQDQYRFSIYLDTIRMALHRPFFGYGLGTFPHVYPQFQSFWTNLFVNHAHNDYLELLSETGVVGFALIAWMMISVFRVGFSKLRRGENDEGRLLTLAAMTGIVSLLVHSLFDFNLHIPANAALFFVLCSAIATPFKYRVRPHASDWSNETVGEP